MKYNKGFAPIVVLLIVLGVLAVGGVAYFAGKSSAPKNEVSDNYFPTTEQNYTPPTTNNNPPPQQQTPPPSNNTSQQQGFISPTTNSTWTLGSSMSIKIKTSPQWFHCSNGFYLYNANNQEIGTVGILTEQGKTTYNWQDISKRYNTCGTGVGEIPIPVSAGTYKICLKETNTETGVGQNFYCSGLFSIVSPTVTSSGCSPNDPPSITVLSPNGGETYSSGQQTTVKWKSCNIPTSENMAVDLYNANDPSSGNCPLAGPTPNDGSEVVNLATSSCRYLNFQSGNNFKLRVYQLNSPIGTIIQDFSNNNFTIN